MCCCFFLTVNITELWNPVNMSILLAKFIPFFLCKELFNVRILINIVIQSNQGTGIIELSHTISTINQIRILTTGDQGSYSFLSSLSCKPCLFTFSTCNLSNFLLNFIIIIDFCTGNCKECSKFFYFAIR